MKLNKAVQFRVTIWPECSPDIQVFKEIDSFRKNLTVFYDKCGEMCEAECDGTGYYLQLMKSDEASSYTRFKFYGSEFPKLKITQIPKMTEFNLISGIGGALGLFIGVRFLSLVEFCNLTCNSFFLLELI